MTEPKVPPDIPCRDGSTEHRWRIELAVEGCHFYASDYVCVECGASFTVTLERDLGEDPWSAVWMADEGGVVPCNRCAELLKGAKPREATVEIGAPQ